MPTSDRPPRPDEAVGQHRVQRRWSPVLGVLAVIGLVTFGARGVDEAVAAPVSIDGVVEIRPDPGWLLDSRSDDGQVHQLLLRKGTVGLFVLGIQGRGGTPADLADAYANEGLGQEFARVSTGSAETTTLAGGVAGVRYGYVGITSDGVTVEGVVVAAVGPDGDAVVFDGFAPQGDLAAAAEELRTMIQTAEVR